MRICITCTRLYDRDSAPGQRCPACQAPVTRQRNARPSGSARGLGWAFSRRKQADPAYQAATSCQCTGCPWCGRGCGVAFTAANPKTGGHATPRSRGGSDSPITATCRNCNSADGGQIGHRA